MGKFGRKVEVQTDLSKYLIGIMAPSGFGKTTLMYNVCEKEFGSDGYIVLDMGTEDGTAALRGVVAEPVPTWKKMKEVVDDIVNNKDSDYPNLKVVVIDTLDEAYNIAEQYCVSKWNTENQGKPGFIKATSINGVEGGFGKGLDATIALVKNMIVKLKKVGVGVFWTAHVKEKDVPDLFTGETYTVLTANLTQRYFNAIKNSTHIVGFGYFNRGIEKKEVGDANPVTKKKKERKVITDETRRIKFRDDTMIADAKSRFAHIIDDIPLNADDFIKAIKDAIESEGGVPTNKTVKTPVEEPVETLNSVDIDDEPDTETVPVEVEEFEEVEKTLFEQVADMVAMVGKETKLEIKQILVTHGLAKLAPDMPEDVLKEIYGVLKDNIPPLSSDETL